VASKEPAKGQSP